MPAPAFPAALDGTRAPLMLAYLADHWAPNTHLREILQSEGHEFDLIAPLVRDVLHTAADPATCPDWALPMWETMLGIPPRTDWAEADRRTAIAAFFTPAVTEQQVIEFLAAQVPTDPVNITVTLVDVS